MPATDFLIRCLGLQGFLRVEGFKCVAERIIFLKVKPARLGISVNCCTKQRR